MVGPAFTGNSGGFIQTVVDLSSFAGKNALIRFRMGSDVLSGATGWYVDDVELLVNHTSFANTAQVDVRFGESKTAAVETMVLREESPSAQTVQAVLEEEGLQIKMYPNPVRGRLNLAFSEEVSGQVEVSLLNLLGQQVLNRSFNGDKANGNSLQLNISDLTKGIYYVKVTANSVTTTRKIVIGE